MICEETKKSINTSDDEEKMISGDKFKHSSNPKSTNPNRTTKAPENDEQF